MTTINRIPIDQLASSMLQLSEMYNLSGQLGKTIRNMDLIINGSNGDTITVFTANLYQLAVKYYGDAMKWTVIAEANNLFDTNINSSTPVTLVIPRSGQDTGGIISQ